MGFTQRLQNEGERNNKNDKKGGEKIKKEKKE